MKKRYSEISYSGSYFTRNLLIVLLAFLSIGAIYGGGAFILKPDGSLFQIPVSLLESSPFPDFLIPGLILLITFGLIPLFLIWALLKKPKYPFLEKLNLFYDHHFAWTFTVYIGLGLVIWIAVQTKIFNAVDRLHTIYTFYGIIVVALALLPSVRKRYIHNGIK